MVGGYNSTPRYPEIDWAPEEPVNAVEVRELLASGATLIRNPASRFSFVRQDKGVLLFVDGECFECEGEVADFAESLCASDSITLHPDLTDAQEVITGLLNQGSLAVDDD